MEMQPDSSQYIHEAPQPLKDQNETFDHRLRAWLESLSPEGRSAALSINDGAFVSTLMHFMLLSSSQGGRPDEEEGVDGKTKIDGGKSSKESAKRA